MDTGQYTTLVEALRAVADPRKRRGQRYPWVVLLSLIVAAMASGERHGRGISQWIRERGSALSLAMGLPAQRIPSEATVRRVLRMVDVAELDARIAEFGALQPPIHRVGGWVGQALDGKEVRGSRAHGRVRHLLALVRHDGVVVGQTEVADKTNEIRAAPQLLAGRDLTGTVTTMDALLTQRALAAQIRRHGGHYLMIVKDNQPTLAWAIATLFETAPWLQDERRQAYQAGQTVDKGHGRVETRTVEASPLLNDWAHWPGLSQVLRRTCRRVHLATGIIEEEVSYAVTSVPFAEAGPAVLARLWRDHWTIENRVHYVRDVTMGEDAGQCWVGQTARALAGLRNGLLTALRVAGWTNIPDAQRHLAADYRRALAFIGVPEHGL
jgi:predicted transposase YbfD/YdcC